MREEYDQAPDFAGYAGTAEFFRATLRKEGETWRISCWGGDDTAYERTGMTEATARRVYGALRDFITIRSLRGRLGFKNW